MAQPHPHRGSNSAGPQLGDHRKRKCPTINHPTKARYAPTPRTMALNMEESLRRLVNNNSTAIDITKLRDLCNRSAKDMAKAKLYLNYHPHWFRSREGQRKLASLFEQAFEVGDAFIRALPSGAIHGEWVNLQDLRIILLAMGIQWREVNILALQAVAVMLFIKRNKTTRNWARFMIILDN